MERLSSPNIWWRLNAQRLLVDRADGKAVPALTQMATGNSAMGRLHALWTLEGMGKLTAALLEAASKDSVAGVRENAIKLIELPLKDFPSLGNVLLAMQDDANPKVRYRLLCTLGYLDTRVQKCRHKLIFQDIEDKWVQIAALSHQRCNRPGYWMRCCSTITKTFPPYASIVKRLAAMIGADGSQSAIQPLIRTSTNNGVTMVPTGGDLFWRVLLSGWKAMNTPPLQCANNKS